ncbi:MAG: paraquat-inducible protein A [Prevotellaceae bacterium]|nr:paraquat-inducible protein A [Prevotellaceae bacterium]
MARFLFLHFILPVFKYIELIIRVSKNKTSKILQNLDKWNMLDVFLVALLILNFKLHQAG